jgi:NitT/TauT family transport system substrate-binding protein
LIARESPPRKDTMKDLTGSILADRLALACSAVVLAGALSSSTACQKTTPRAAPADATPTTAASRTTLALNWLPEPEFGGFYAARESGAYKKAGLDVQIQGGGAGVPVVQMVATARADFGTVGADELVMARARGADVVAVFATFQTAPQGIMVHASRGLKRLEDAFRSGTLALETGLPYIAYLRQKFPWGGAKIVTYDGGVAHFLADPMFGQQCFVTSEPIAARQKGGDPQVFLIADAGFNPYATVVITRGDLLRRNPQLVRAFVAATADGWRRYLDDPKPTNQLLGTLNHAMDAATLVAAAEAQAPLVETSDTKKLGLGTMARTRWQTLVEQMVSLKLIDRPIDVDALFVAPGAHAP